MSKLNIHGSEYPIKKIFSDDFVFTIPVYQRAYAWTIEESEELFQDLIRAKGDAEEAIDDISPYFLGSIVLIKGDEPDAQVVDGQQRLATLTMYNGPRKLDTERGRNKIYSRHDEKTVYNRIQGKSGSGTLEGREDLGTNCYGV